MSLEKALGIGYRDILRIALPLTISGLAHNMINIVDTAFMGHLGTFEIGAVGNGGLLFFAFAITGLGFSTGMQILIGRRNGEQDYRAIGELFRSGLVAITGIGILLWFIVYFGSGFILEPIVQNETIKNFAIEYLQYRSPAIIFSSINFLFLGFFVGITKTRAVSYAFVITAIVNIALDYCLVFGKFGFPRLEIQGAAIASVIAEASATIFYVAYMSTILNHKLYQIFTTLKIKAATLVGIIKLAWPIMGRNLISLSGWFIFFSIVEHLGTAELAVSHIIRGVYMFLVVPIFSLSDTTSTMISNLIGQNQRELIWTLIKRIMVIGLCVTTTLVLIIQFFDDTVFGIFTEDELLITMSRGPFIIISMAIFVFTIAFVLFKAVMGFGNTKASFITEFTSVTVYLLSAYLFVFVLEGSIELAWCAEFPYFITLGLVSFIYLKSSKWKSVNI